jgi:hypothetical protein
MSVWVTAGFGWCRALVNDGVWELTDTVVAYSAVGQYTPTYLDASDRLGHRQSISTLNTPAFTLTGVSVTD